MFLTTLSWCGFPWINLSRCASAIILFPKEYFVTTKNIIYNSSKYLTTTALLKMKSTKRNLCHIQVKTFYRETLLTLKFTKPRDAEESRSDGEIKVICERWTSGWYQAHRWPRFEFLTATAAITAPRFDR